MSKITNPLAIVFDCGTQSTRAILFDKNGKLIAKKKIEFTPYYSLQSGWAEQRADLYFEKICEASQALKKEYPDEFKQIVTSSITVMRDNGVCLDKELKPIRDVILWLDQRKAKAENQIPTSKKLIFGLVGMGKAVKEQMKQGKCNWIRENEPEIWAKTEKYVMLSCYLNYKLTGKLIDSTASQIGHIPFDYKNKKWMSPKDLKAEVFIIPENMRYDLVSPCEMISEISEEASKLTGIPKGTPIIASGSDKGCETLGTGCITEGIASLSFGTTATIQMASNKYVEPQTFMPAYPAVVPDSYNPEIQIYRGYWMITWFKEQFAGKEVDQAKELGISPETILDKTLEEIPAGSDGLVLQPYWSPVLKAPEAKGAIIGFSDSHTKAHLYKSIIEGIGYGLVAGYKDMEKRLKYNTTRITVSGGGSSSDQVCQITADMFGIPVSRVQTYETSGLGAAIAAFVGVKEFENLNDAIKSMVHYTDSFEPNSENHKVYDKIYETVYKKIYKKLKPMYSNILDILKK